MNPTTSSIIVTLAIAFIFIYVAAIVGWFFTGPHKVTTETKPQIDEVWIKKSDDPWGVTGHVVKILDVRDGWVRYHFNAHNPDNRKTIKSFIKYYQKVT